MPKLGSGSEASLEIAVAALVAVEAEMDGPAVTVESIVSSGPSSSLAVDSIGLCVHVAVRSVA